MSDLRKCAWPGCEDLEDPRFGGRCDGHGLTSDDDVLRLDNAIREQNAENTSLMARLEEYQREVERRDELLAGSSPEAIREQVEEGIRTQHGALKARAEKAESERDQAQREAKRYRETLVSICQQCAEGFVACDRCSEEIPMDSLDIATEARQALRSSDAGRGWLAPEDVRKVREAILTVAYDMNGDGTWRVGRHGDHRWPEIGLALSLLDSATKGTT